MTEESLFELAVNTPQNERAALLERECAGNSALRARVEALLAADARPAEWLANDKHTAAYRPAIESAGTIIAGKYKLLQQIGEGGMGSVWMADQTEPVKRRVAVKLIRVERSGSRTILARFEAERQAIALMDHPNIARLLDAGTTGEPGTSAAGVPFFVMDLVKGVPLTEYCDTHKLSIPDRLNLFMQICSAVQHAHQKGIIHRDLKPTNILIESHDGKPVPKVIDFGLAKATSGLQLTENTLFTGFGSVMGTPLYMAPEQANFNAVDVDTRADIYALGVILYELLTGTTPIARETIKKAALDVIIKLVREQEAPSPSSRISTSEAQPNVAANRQMEPAKLGRFVKGELDWIVLKALAKERDRRYETANGFARDIERFLSHEPVQAGPPSASYRFKKFVQRNRGPVIAASLVVLALLAGSAGTTIGLVQANWAAEAERQAKLDAQDAAEAERLAKVEAELLKEKAVRSAAREAEERKKAESARTEALAKEAEANAVVKFFEERVFAAGRPKGEAGGLGHGVPLRDAIRASLPALGKSFTDQPLVEARLRLTLGTTFEYLGEHAQAAEHREQARALFTRHHGPDHADTLASMHNLAKSYYSLGRRAEALKLREETLAARKRVLPPDHPDTLSSMNNLANSYEAANRYVEALKLREQTLAAQKRVLPPDHPSTLRSMNNLASSYATLNRHAEALKLHEETLAARKRVLPPDHPDTLGSMNNLASSYTTLNRHVEALKLHEETLAASKRVLPPDHPATLISMHNLASSYAALNHHAEALKLREETLAAQKRVLPPDHPDILKSMNNLASSYAALKRHAEALKLHEETLAVQKRVLPPDHPDILKSMDNLASSYTDLNRPAEAVKLDEETLAARKRVLPPDHPDTLSSMYNLAFSYAALGRHAEAAKLCEETLAARKRVLPPDHPDTLMSMHNLADSYAALNRHDEALKLHEETLAARKRVLPPDHPDTLKGMNNLAISFAALNRHAEALKLREETLATRKRVLLPDHPDTLGSLYSLASSYAALKRHAEAVPLLDEVMAKANRPGVDPRLNPLAIALKLRCCQKLGDVVGCRASAEMLEKRKPTDAKGFYDAACYRAVTATLQAKAKEPDAARLAREDADNAMVWLTKAVAAGWTDAAHMKKDADIDALRDRADFQKLLADLDRKVEKK